MVELEAPFHVTSANVDPEIAHVAGPQLVCPVDNARFVLNAANARWGSLLDAVYGTNALLPPPPKGPYDAQRGASVFEAVHGLLDELFPLASGSWGEVSSLAVKDGALRATVPIGSSGGKMELGLRSADHFVGYTGIGDGLGEGTGDASCWSLLLKRNGLHAEVIINGDHNLGEGVAESRSTAAGIVDVRLESALSTICDFEDSACTVDAEDKVDGMLMRRPNLTRDG